LSLEVSNSERSLDEELERVLRGLNWERTAELPGEAALTLSVRGNGSGHRIPAGAREILRRDDFRGFEEEGRFYLTDGATLLHVCSDEARAEVHHRAFFLYTRDPDSRRQFWMFALVKLLQGLGVYSLHAAGLVANDGAGILLVGDSGSGKSTLTYRIDPPRLAISLRRRGPPAADGFRDRGARAPAALLRRRSRADRYADLLWVTWSRTRAGVSAGASGSKKPSPRSASRRAFPARPSLLQHRPP
jgi:hypothetical protein